jgi:alkanesulfonate monooxygenase SsuD/methylene tetrahydromethanopterin reductase-like flavin-dependent oxidoreductase (luciferase family)
VVAHGHAFHAAFEDLDTLQAHWARLGELCDEAGRDRGELGFSVRWYLDPAGRMPAEKSLQGSADQMTDQLGTLADAGVDHVLIDITAPGGLEGRREAMESFMRDVAV